MAQHRGPGAALGMEKPRVKDTRGTLKRLWWYLRHQRMGLITAITLVVLSTGLNLVGPYLMGRAIDDYIIPGDMDGLGRLVLIMGGVYVVFSAVQWLQGVIMAGVAQRTVHHIRRDLFAKLQKLPLRFFDQRPHGDTMSRVTNDVETLSQILTEGTTQILSSVLTGVGVIILMLALEPLLGLVGIVSLLTMAFIVNRFIGKRTKEGFREQQRDLGTLNGIIE